MLLFMEKRRKKQDSHFEKKVIFKFLLVCLISVVTASITYILSVNDAGVQTHNHFIVSPLSLTSPSRIKSKSTCKKIMLYPAKH